jgi:hypothetical protein
VGKHNLYNLGSIGVDKTKSVIHKDDGSWASAQNLQPDPRDEFGGVTKRDGLTAINGTGAGAALMGAVDVPFPAITTRAFYVGLDSTQTDTFRRSTDTFSSSAGVTSPSRVEDKDYIDGQASSYGSMMATAGNKLYYMKSGTANIVSYDGVEERVLFTVPTTSALTAKYVIYMMVDGAYLYFITIDAEGASAQKSRVWQYATDSGALLQLGEVLGLGGVGETNSHALCLAVHQNQVFVGMGEIRNNGLGAGRIYRIRPGVDSAWTLDHTCANTRDWVMSLCSYNGLLYAGIVSGGNTTTADQGKVLVRGTDNAWTESVNTGGTPTVARNGFTSLVVFGGNLYSVRTKRILGTTTSDIYKFDGSSWTQALSIDVLATAEGGPTLVHNDRLYMLTVSDVAVGKVHHTADGSTWTTATTGLTADVQAAFGVLVT